MNKVIPCTKEILEKMPNIMPTIYDTFETSNVGLFAVLEDNHISLVAISGEKGLYIENYDSILQNTYFKTNKNFSLQEITLDGITYLWDSLNAYSQNEEATTERLLLMKREEYDYERYDGSITYIQYSQKLDMCLELHYQQMYYDAFKKDSRPPIYRIHTKLIDSVFLDKDCSKHKPVEYGIVRPSSQYYARYDIRDNKIASFLGKNDTNDFYYPVYAINKNGDFITLYPFSKSYTEEQIKEKIESFGFNTSIPETLLRIYNHEEERANKIEDILGNIKKSIEQEQEDCMMLIKVIQK